MNYDRLKESLSKDKWNSFDHREIKDKLALDTLRMLEKFKPIKPNKYKDNPIQVLDFFSGAGGTSLGFASLNKVIPAFNLLGGCDINSISATTYSHNYGTYLINEDVTDLAYTEGKLDDLLVRIAYDFEKPTILIGCAPCQGFSSHRKKHWNEEEDMRNSLILAFVNIVKKVDPDVIIMENVPEFLSERYWKYFKTSKERFESMGYVVKQTIYNAATFGVPQERFRSIIIGMKKNFLLPSGLLKRDEFRTVRDAIGKLPPVKAGVADPLDPMHKSAAHKQSTIDVIKKVPHDGGNRPAGIGPACLEKTKGFSDVYGRLYWDRPSITITHYARNPASGRYTHPEQDRGLTARETAALQSFPSGFDFSGNADDVYRQIGEAVPPRLSSAIAASVLVELISSEPTKEQEDNSPRSIENPVSSSYSSVIAGIKSKEKVVK